MAIENDIPDLPDFDIEGFNSESNILRPDRNYLINPLSEWERNYISIKHPEWKSPIELLDPNDLPAPTVLDFGLPSTPKFGEDDIQEWDVPYFNPDGSIAYWVHRKYNYTQRREEPHDYTPPWLK